ncbi:MAG TPA: DUF817 domain-containing protein [Pseudolysinimonas sp.]|nr:DUF817 domain-containing protein [Pseudolysinimonas sp.]
MTRFTPVEQRIDDAAHRLLERFPRSAAWATTVEFLVFGAKQAWACLFGALLLAALLGAHFFYPDSAAVARNDLLTLVAVALQGIMLAARLETFGELRVILLFHVVGTVMELFKTDVGSWVYASEGVLRVGAVPLFTGFMYGAVGSYMVRVFRLFELRFERYPRRWITAIVAAAIYINFFSHHFIVDLRALLIAAILIVYWPTMLEARVFRRRLRLPILVAFLLVAVFIWIAEQIGTGTATWIYPSQADGWHPVSIAKVGSWFLLMMISVVLVTWVYPPEPPGVLPDAGAVAVGE